MFRIIFLALILILTLGGAQAATVHGTVYEWSTFKPVDNAWVKVNSTPPQQMKAIDGYYSFNLPPGNYKNSLEYAEENITVAGEGDFVLDFLLFPQTELDEEPLINTTNFSADEYGELRMGNLIIVILITIIVFVVMVLLTAYRLKKKAAQLRKEREKARQEAGEAAKQARLSELGVSKLQALEPIGLLPQDLKEVLEIITQSGGRLTQKDLRKKLGYSEAKVSLMVADLEDRGLVKKIKKGRGNIIRLSAYEEKP